MNKPNEKDNASARLTLLQVLGLICPTAGRIMSNSDIFFAKETFNAKKNSKWLSMSLMVQPATVQVASQERWNASTQYHLQGPVPLPVIFPCARHRAAG